MLVAMTRSVVVVLLAMSSLARAQPAPAGQPDPGQPPAGQPAPGQPPAGQPPAGQPAPGQPPPQTIPVPARTGVMAHRWSVAVGIGIESLTPKVDNGATTGFASLELTGRFRPWRAIEFGLALDLGTAGNLGSSGLYGDFRYRFMAEKPINVFAMVGLGIGSAYDRNTTVGEEKQGRGAFRIGGGGEWRFDTFALTAELRLFAIGENPKVTTTTPRSTGNDIARYQVSGASFVLGAAYYF